MVGGAEVNVVGKGLEGDRGGIAGDGEEEGKRYEENVGLGR